MMTTSRCCWLAWLGCAKPVSARARFARRLSEFRQCASLGFFSSQAFKSCPLFSTKSAMETAFYFLLLAVVGLFLPGAEAASFDAGDAVALVLGLVIGILGILACLGAYARRRSGA